MKLPRNIRKIFPEASNEGYLGHSPKALIRVDGARRMKNGTLHMSQEAVYVVTESFAGLNTSVFRLAFQEMTDIQSAHTESRFGRGKPGLIFKTAEHSFDVVLYVDLLGATKQFVTELEARVQRPTNPWLTFADLMITEWELDHAIDDEEHQDAAVDTKVLVCDAVPTIRERVAATIQRFEDAGENFSDDGITDRIIAESGYRAVRARVLSTRT